ncbi:ATP-binding cassette sub-family G member 8-like [Mytilus galloprovincialis]
MPWEVTECSGPQKVLDNVTFTAKSGQLLAIMGSSGSGKTSLLDVLAGRITVGEILGDVYLNGVQQNNSMIRSFSAYVKQDDRLLPHLTIKETLMFVAELKLPTTFTSKKIEDRVDSVIAELGLRHVSNSKVGNAESRGVSGGERRRVSIGIQLLLDPSIIFLDEPTSGLDAFTAHHLVETLAKMSRNNRTVIMSIHQPRSDIFELFDRVMIMTKGNVVYNGEAAKMVDYFTNLGYPCPHLTNPGDYYIDLVTLDSSSEETEKSSRQTMENLLQNYTQKRSVVSEQDISVHTEEEVPMMDMLNMINKFSQSPGYFRQFSVLFRRCTRNILEDYLNLSAQFIQAFAMSFVVGLVYYKLAYGQSNIRDWFGLMYILAALYPYMVILDVIAQYHNERNYLYCELEDHLYAIGPYYFAKIFSELPLHTFYVIVYVIPAYFLAGLTNDVSVFFQVFGLLYLMIYCSRSLAMLSSAILPNFQLSCFFAQTFFSMFIMSAGFFINLDNIFSGLQWVSNISYLKWGFQGLVYAEIPKLTFECSVNATVPCIENGDQAIVLYALDGGSVLESVLAILGSIFAYLLLYFICLRFIPQKPHQM